MRRPHATDPGRARFWRHSASSRRAPENPEIQTKIAEHEAHGTKQRPEHVRQHRDNIARIARIVSPPWKGPKIGPPDPPHYDAAELACWVCAADGTSTRSVPVSRASELGPRIPSPCAMAMFRSRYGASPPRGRPGLYLLKGASASAQAHPGKPSIVDTETPRHTL